MVILQLTGMLMWMLGAIGIICGISTAPVPCVAALGGVVLFYAGAKLLTEVDAAAEEEAHALIHSRRCLCNQCRSSRAFQGIEEPVL